MKSLYIVGGPGLGYDDMFINWGWNITDVMINADLVLFTGGSDVHPSLYGEQKHPYSHCHLVRDHFEAEQFEEARLLNIPMVGICRGGQFLNVMSGGTMYQHVDGHAIAGTHEAIDLDTGEKVQVSSTHHQMMRPSGEGTIIAVAYQSSFKEYMEDEEIKKIDGGRNEPDVEVVFYRDTNCLCFQPHPEFFGKGHPCQDYFFNQVEKYLGV